MPIVNNDDELMMFFIKDAQEVVDEVTFKLLEVLKDYIMQIVYRPYRPKVYPRLMYNGGLLEDWVKTPSVVSGNEVYSIIEEDPYNMLLNKKEFIHGSLVKGENDIRRYLSEIIIEGESGPLFGEGFWRQPRDFFEPFLSYVDKNVDRLIRESFKKRGIQLI